MSFNTEPTLIAILDDYTSIAPPHLNTLLQDTSLNANPKIDYFPDTLNPRDPAQLPQLITRLKPYTIISTMRERTPFPRDLLSALPNLRFLLTTGPYNASIDLDAAKELSITVTCTKTAKPNSTNEQTWALILAVTKQLAADDRRVKAGGWQEGISIPLAGRKLGVLGLGRLGTECAVTGKLGFNMDVLAWSMSLTQEEADEIAVKRGLEKGTFKVTSSKEELFKEADVLSVHYVLSDRSRGIVGEKELRLMKKDAFLVNTSRGPLVDEAALLTTLREGRIRGVGLDVYDIEPLPRNSPWRSQEWGSRVVLSPHTGYVDEETMNSWYAQQADNMRRWLKGEEVVNLLQKKQGK